MKFHNKLDVQSFLVEIGRPLQEAIEANEGYVPTSEELSSFISGRTSLVKNIKNRRQSANSKANWRENRYKIMRGIKSFHKSTDGKRFHRKLGRFLATRITKDKRGSITDESIYDKHEALNGISSLKQHLVVELGYFHSLYEQVEIEELIMDNALPVLTEIENKVLTGNELTADEITFISDMIDQNTLLDEIAKITGESFDNLKKWCEDITIDLQNKGITYDSPEFVSELLKTLLLSSHETKNSI